MDSYIVLELLIVSIAATSCMTLFSYLVSINFTKLHKVPVLLTAVFLQSKMHLPTNSKANLAWLLHYLIGFVFVIVYYLLWLNNILSVSLFSGLLLGLISGAIGVMSWIIIFKTSNYKPKIDFKGYYTQLFIAHIIFALVATMIYALSVTIVLVVEASL